MQKSSSKILKISNKKLSCQRKIQDQPDLELTSLADGTLGPLSDYDLKVDPVLSEVGLPFLEKEGFEKSFSTFSHPEQVQKNLVFRALLQIPPQASIRSVKTLKLKLKGVKVSATQPDSIFEGQSLCLLDSKICLGSKPELAKEGESGGNPKFWMDATVYPEGLPLKTEFKEISAGEAGSKVYSTASGEWEFDLMELLHLSGKSAIGFLVKQSNDYSAPEAGFRKFRFSIGNRISAEGGELLVEYDLDQNSIPKDYSKRLPSPIHGASDIVNVDAKRSPRGLRDLKGVRSDEFAWIFDQKQLIESEAEEALSPQGQAKIVEMSRRLSAHRSEVEQIDLVSLSHNEHSLKVAASIKSALVQSGWSEKIIVVYSKVDKTERQAIGVGVKLQAAIESDPSAKKSILDDLRKDFADLADFEESAI